MSVVPIVSADDRETGIIYDSLIWAGNNMIELSYTEEHNRGDGACLVTTLVIDVRKLEVEYQELLDALGQLVDSGTIVVRNPPKTIPSRQ